MRWASLPVVVYGFAGLTTAADKLAFVSPSGGGSVQYEEGKEMAIEWTTPFERTNLEVWQGPHRDGAFAMKTLVCRCQDRMSRMRSGNADNTTANGGPDQTSYSWTAQSLDETDLTRTFHFRLQKSDQPNLCPGCTAQSEVFRVGDSTKIVTVPANVTPLPPDQNDTGLPRQDRLMIGLSIGIAAFVVISFVTLVVCTQRYRNTQARRAQDLAEQECIDAEQRELARQPIPLQLDELTRCSTTYADSCRSWTTSKQSIHNRPKSDVAAVEIEHVDGEIGPGWETLPGREQLGERPQPRPAGHAF